MLYPDIEIVQTDLQRRPVCGKDLLFLQHWLDLSIAEACFLFGMPFSKWQACTEGERADRPLDDIGVSLLAWTLIAFPETHFLPRYPTPAEVYPLYRAVAEKTPRTLATAYAPTPLGKTAYGLLLGREITSPTRWLSETDPRPADPQVARLAFALRGILQLRGVGGLEAWFDRAGEEARARGLTLNACMTSWSRMDDRKQSRGRPRGRPAGSGKKRRRPADAAGERP